MAGLGAKPKPRQIHGCDRHDSGTHANSLGCAAAVKVHAGMLGSAGSQGVLLPHRTVLDPIATQFAPIAGCNLKGQLNSAIGSDESASEAYY